LRIEGFDCFRSGQRTDAGELFGRAAKTRPFQSPQAVRFQRRIKNEVCAAKSSVCGHWLTGFLKEKKEMKQNHPKIACAEINPSVRIALQCDFVKEMLEEVNALLELDVDGNLPVELRKRLVYFLESPAEIMSVDRKRGFAVRAGECRIRLNVSDSFLEFLLALRAWYRELNITV
jgi:hypothetical protein